MLRLITTEEKIEVRMPRQCTTAKPRTGPEPKMRSARPAINVVTLIAGLALLIFGSGPVRGFAVVHCLGILTSIFSSVVVSRSMVNLAYGTRRKLERVAIGNTAWK